ncbi:hypothetical protein [Nocardiopsis synnemataformans]|uniref:hypothetical protein n=1 Tax=Nocardiopsis synnemataformans TaxID=61305 RepID=UPI003EBD19E1
MGVFDRLLPLRVVCTARVPRVTLLSSRPGLEVTITRPPWMSSTQLREITDVVRATEAFSGHPRPRPRIEIHLGASPAAVDMARAMLASERRAAKYLGSAR